MQNMKQFVTSNDELWKQRINEVIPRLNDMFNNKSLEQYVEEADIKKFFQLLDPIDLAAMIGKAIVGNIIYLGYFGVKNINRFIMLERIYQDVNDKKYSAAHGLLAILNLPIGDDDKYSFKFNLIKVIFCFDADNHQQAKAVIFYVKDALTKQWFDQDLGRNHNQDLNDDELISLPQTDYNNRKG